MSYVPDESGMEQGPWKTQTLPEDTLSIKQIFERYAKGQPLGGAMAATMANYSDGDQAYVTLDDPDLMELSRMDLSERHEYLEQLKESIAQKKQTIKDAQAALLRKQAAKAAVESDLKDFEQEVEQKDPKKSEASKGQEKASKKAEPDPEK